MKTRYFGKMRFAVAAVLLAAPAWAEEAVVLQSSLPEFAPGAIIKDDQAVKLPDNARLVLVTSSGRTVTLAGPYDGTPLARSQGGGDSRLANALSALVRTSQEDATTVGAVRATQLAPGSAGQVPTIDLSESGTYCFTDPAGLEITRTPKDAAATLTVIAPETDRKASIAWAAGTEHLPWPETLRPGESSVFLVEQSDRDSRTMIELHRIPDVMTTDMQRLVFMVERGCKQQGRALLKEIKKKSEAAATAK